MAPIPIAFAMDPGFINDPDPIPWPRNPPPKEAAEDPNMPGNLKSFFVHYLILSLNTILENFSFPDCIFLVFNDWPFNYKQECAVFISDLRYKSDAHFLREIKGIS